jgi:hypothetical protein
LFTTPRAATIVPDVPENEIFNNTEKEVWALVNTLPKGYYDVYMDDYFSTVRLFLEMRKKRVGACGTARANTRFFPDAFKRLRDQKKTKVRLGLDRRHRRSRQGTGSLLGGQQRCIYAFHHSYN